MPFTEFELAAHLAMLEQEFWSHRRPSLSVRDQMREGQRVEGNSIELFFVRPVWDDPSRTIEEQIAKLTYVRSRNEWRVFWRRADLKWHSYQPHPVASDLAEALRIVRRDEHCCFFG